jgi:hypothetical protein
MLISPLIASVSANRRHQPATPKKPDPKMPGPIVSAGCYGIAAYYLFATKLVKPLGKFRRPFVEGILRIAPAGERVAGVVGRQCPDRLQMILQQNPGFNAEWILAADSGDGVAQCDPYIFIAQKSAPPASDHGEKTGNPGSVGATVAGLVVC